MNNLTRAAAMVALASVMAIPTAPMAASMNSGFSYSGPAVVENAAWRVGRWGGARWGRWGGPFLGFGAGLFGFGLGAAIARDRYYNYYDGYDYGPRYRVNGHVARCAATYRSYDARRDAFLGYDGYWHRCRL